MPPLPSQIDDHVRYTMPHLIDLRRQIAASLRSLFRNKVWLAANTIEGSRTEYRVYALDSEGHPIKAIRLDCPDDKAAIESAKQYIDGRDIELWQLDRRVATFAHKPE